MKQKLKICLLVSDLMGSPGGATAVAVWMVQALACLGELDVYSTGAQPDIQALNRLYGTDLDPSQFRFWYPPWASRLGRQSPWRVAAVARIAREIRASKQRYDLYLSATNEVLLPSPHLQYIHFPQHSWAILAKPGGRHHRLLRLASEFVYRVVGGHWSPFSKSCRVLTNSNWTKEVIRSCYGVEAAVVYPPVRTPAVPLVPWRDRDLACVIVGRFSSEKRTLEAVEIVARLRHQLPALRLHIVGVGAGEYRRRLVSAAQKAGPYVEIHENMRWEELSQMLARSAFGLHCAPEEHFGIAPAEAAAHGCLTFVRRSGGPVEIVSADPKLVYASVDDCCTKLAALARQPNEAAQVADALRRSAAERFSTSRFIASIRAEVEASLSAGRLLCGS